MDWTKYAKGNSVTPKKVSVEVSAKLAEVIESFKQYYPEEKFTTQAVLQTMIEAGVRTWVESVKAEEE